MTTEPTAPEGLVPADDVTAPPTYTHLTLTIQGPQTGAQPIELLLALTDPVDAEDVVVEWDIALPVTPWTPDVMSPSDVMIHEDEIETIYDTLRDALVGHGRTADYWFLQAADVYVMTYVDAEGTLQEEHTYISDSYAHLVDVPWVTSWRFRNA